jgi:hypothetical protein
MLRLLLGLGAVAAAFAGTVSFGGFVTGAWDDVPPPARSEAAAASDRAGERETTRRGRRARVRVTAARRRHAWAAARARWADAATDLCLSAAAQAVAHARPRTLAQFDAYVARLERLNRRFHRALSAVPPAPPDRRLVARLQTLLRRDERAIAGVRAAVRTRDAPRLLELAQELIAVAEQESRIMVRLGAPDCALPRDVGIGA